MVQLTICCQVVEYFAFSVKDRAGREVVVVVVVGTSLLCSQNLFIHCRLHPKILSGSEITAPPPRPDLLSLTLVPLYLTSHKHT